MKNEKKVINQISDSFRPAFKSRNKMRQVAAVNEAKKGKTLLRMMVYGYMDKSFRNIVEKRLAKEPDLLLEVLHMAERVLVSPSPHKFHIPIKWFRERSRLRQYHRRLAYFETIDALLQTVSDISILREFTTSKDENVRAASNKRLRILGDEKAWNLYVQELIHSRFIPPIYNLIYSKDLQKVPDYALALLRNFFVSINGRIEKFKIEHPRVPGSPGHGSTRPWTEYGQHTIDHKNEISHIENEIQRRNSSFRRT